MSEHVCGCGEVFGSAMELEDHQGSAQIALLNGDDLMKLALKAAFFGFDLREKIGWRPSVEEMKSRIRADALREHREMARA